MQMLRDTDEVWGQSCVMEGLGETCLYKCLEFAIHFSNQQLRIQRLK